MFVRCTHITSTIAQLPYSHIKVDGFVLSKSEEGAREKGKTNRTITSAVAADEEVELHRQSIAHVLKKCNKFISYFRSGLFVA